MNAQGQPFEFEILLQGPSFERVALPYVQWLQRLGMKPRVRTVDPAQYQVRMDAFDYDMTVDVIPQSLSPGNEQRDYFTCEKSKQNGSQNIAGICDPVIDEMVEWIVNAPDRKALVARTRALDRVLLWNHYVIPHWHIQTFRIAWWDKFGRPERNPRYSLALDSWWVDPAREGAVEQARREARQHAVGRTLGAYLLRRLALVVPTLFGIILINFAVIQFAPGGPGGADDRRTARRGADARPPDRRGAGRGPRARGAGAQRHAVGAAAGRSAPIAARRASTPPSSPRSRRPSASTSRPLSASGRCCRATCASTSGAACSATGRWWT